MKDLERTIQLFVEERDWDRFHSPKNLAMALSVEVAELMEHFQWLSERESMDIPEDKKALIQDEIGDVLIYLVQLSRKLGIDPVEAAHQKVGKNRLKYPASRVRGKAWKNSEYKENRLDR
jgi:dCTP diphosphatase